MKQKKASPDNRPAIVMFSHIMGLAVIRALGRMKVPVVALYQRDSEMAQYSRYVKQRIKMPDPLINEEKYIDKLISLSKKFPRGLLLPADDYTVVIAAKHKEKLAKYFSVGVEDWDLVKKLIQKQYTYEIASSLKIPCPVTFVPKSKADIKKYIDKIHFPCLIKPCESHIFYDHFQKKMFKLMNKEELLKKYEEMEKIGFKVMIQELIPGDDGQGVNYNSLCIDGVPCVEFTARKIRIDPPFFGSPRVLVSKHIPEITGPAKTLLKALKYNGFSCIEFKKDSRNGIYKLMEVNCRHNLTGSLAVKCGINFPFIHYTHIMKNTLLKGNDFKENVYWIDIMKDFMRFLKSRNEEKYALGEYIYPYIKKKVFAIFDVSDPMPFIMRTFFIIKELFLNQ